ncbi:MAG: hypothetical protein AAGE65_05465 [Planctomycetota bacterium]
MLLKVGPFVYRVVLVAGYIRHEGDDCLGLCDNETHELFVSDRCSVAQQIQVISHEYMEAWFYHFGREDMDKEAWCDLFGLAMTQFTLDLMQTLRLEPAAWAAGMSGGSENPNGPPRRDPGTSDPEPGDPKAPRTRRASAVRVFRAAEASNAEARVSVTASIDAPPGTPASPITPTPHRPDVERWRTAVVETLKRGLQTTEDA